MSSEEELLLGSGIERQGQAMNEVVHHLLSLLQPQTDYLDYYGRFLRTRWGSVINSVSADGTMTRLDSTYSIDESVSSLRGAMYTPGAGTWFSMQMTIWPNGRSQSRFNYDDEPDWGPIPPGGISFLTDQHFFPIDEDKQPEWLKKRLAEGVADLKRYGKKSYPEWLVEMIAAGNKPAWL